MLMIMRLKRRRKIKKQGVERRNARELGEEEEEEQKRRRRKQRRTRSSGR